MCSGVIVITNTITTCPAISAINGGKDARSSQHLPQRRTDAPSDACTLGREGFRSRAKGEEREERRGGHEEHRHAIDTSESRQVEAFGDVPREGDQIWANDGAECRTPHHDADRRGTTRLGVHVGGGVARELIGSICAAHRGGGGDEERERGEHHGDSSAERTSGADPVAEHEPSASPVQHHEAREELRGGGGAEHDRCPREPCEARAARELLRHDRGDGDGGDVAGAAEAYAQNERGLEAAPR